MAIKADLDWVTPLERLDTEDRTMTQYIATDQGGREQWMAIYGIGETAEAAIRDARFDSNNPDGEYDALPATERLIERVREAGGAPHDVSWTVRNGVADLDDEA